jgi:hypothetical protein
MIPIPQIIVGTAWECTFIGAYHVVTVRLRNLKKIPADLKGFDQTKKPMTSPYLDSQQFQTDG